MSRQIKHSLAVLVDNFEVRTTCHQERDRFRLVSARGTHDSCITSIVAAINAGSVVQQPTDEIVVSTLGSNVKRRGAFGSGLVDIGALFLEVFHLEGA